MTYWGNDIVALNDPLLRQENRLTQWLAKVCTVEELAALSSCDDKHIGRWRLWSCKESVYKILIKQGVAPFLNPRRIEIKAQTSDWGATEFSFQASFGEGHFQGYSKLTANWVHSISCTKAFFPDDYYTEVIPTERPTASVQLRQRVIEILQQDHRLAVEAIEQSAQNVPIAVDYTGKFKVDLSFSHHEPYSAYLISLTKNQGKY